MMSPVVRMSRPFSKAARKAEKRPPGRLSRHGLKLDGADQTEIAHVDDMRQPLERMDRVFRVASQVVSSRRRNFRRVLKRLESGAQRRRTSNRMKCQKKRTATVNRPGCNKAPRSANRMGALARHFGGRSHESRRLRA